jgi:hypothetical protein
LIPLNNILPSDNCLTQDQIINYLNGTTTALENSAIEHHFTNCTLCSDAIDGLAALSHQERTAILKNIPNQFVPKTGTTMHIGWQRIAAIASGLLIASIAGAWYYNSIYNQPNVVAKVETTIPSTIETPSVNKPENIIVADNTQPIDSNVSIKNTRPTNTVTTGEVQQIGSSTLTGKVAEAPVTKQYKTDGVPISSLSAPTDEVVKANVAPRNDDVKYEAKEATEPPVIAKETEKLRNEDASYDKTVTATAPAGTIQNYNVEKNITKASKSIVQKKQKDIYPAAVQNNLNNGNYNYNDNNNQLENIQQAKAKTYTPVTTENKTNTAFEIANTAFKNKNYKAAIVYYKSCVANNLNKDEAEYQLALSYKLNGDTQLADALFSKIANANTRFQKAASEALSK